MFSGSSLIQIRETFFFFFFSSLFCWPWPYSGLSVEAKTPTHNDYDDVNEISPIFHYLREKLIAQRRVLSVHCTILTRLSRCAMGLESLKKYNNCGLSFFSYNSCQAIFHNSVILLWIRVEHSKLSKSRHQLPEGKRKW